MGSARKELSGVVTAAMSDDGYMGTITVVNRLVGWLSEHDKAVRDEAYADGFAAQRDAEAVLVLQRVLRYAELDASAHTDPRVLAYLNDDLIPWLQARIAEASS